MPRDHSRGDFLTGATHSASAKPAVEKGAYLTGGPIAKRASRLPAELAEFQSAADFADQLGASRNYLALERWARDAQEAIEALRRKVRR
jgi:hypothetical protein